MLKKVETSQLKDLYENHISQDFPRSERPPYEMMLAQLEKGIQEGYILYDEEENPLGYCINAAAHENGYVLISLFAAMAGNRGKGIGTTLMKALLAHYQDTKGIFLEVERPEAGKDEEEKELRERRIRFYQRLGYQILPNIDYCLFNVPMYIMVYPLAEELKNDEYYLSCLKDIYEQLLPPHLRERLQASVKND